MRRSSRAAGRDLVLVVSVLTALLGVRLVGSSLAGPAPSVEMGAKGSHARTSSILPSTAASPLVVEVHVTSDLTLPRGHPLEARLDTVVASREEDPRAYLTKMAALRFRQRLTAPTALDPYQTSLNPTVYVAGIATPIGPDCSIVSLPADQRCRFPYLPHAAVRHHRWMKKRGGDDGRVVRAVVRARHPQAAGGGLPDRTGIERRGDERGGSFGTMTD